MIPLEKLPPDLGIVLHPLQIRALLVPAEKDVLVDEVGPVRGKAPVQEALVPRDLRADVRNEVQRQQLGGVAFDRVDFEDALVQQAEVRLDALLLEQAAHVVQVDHELLRNRRQDLGVLVRLFVHDRLASARRLPS